MVLLDQGNAQPVLVYNPLLEGLVDAHHNSHSHELLNQIGRFFLKPNRKILDGNGQSKLKFLFCDIHRWWNRRFGYRRLDSCLLDGRLFFKHLLNPDLLSGYGRHRLLLFLFSDLLRRMNFPDNDDRE